LPKAGLNGFDWTFVQGSAFVLRLNFCAKNPRLRQYPNRQLAKKLPPQPLSPFTTYIIRSSLITYRIFYSKFHVQNCASKNSHRHFQANEVCLEKCQGDNVIDRVSNFGARFNSFDIFILKNLNGLAGEYFHSLALPAILKR